MGNYSCPGTTLIPHRAPFLLLAALLIPTIVCAADFSGPVVSFLDGDTIEVPHNSKVERIRLSGIDCTEKGQAFGKQAKHAGSDLAFGKEGTIQTHGYDKYRRTLADVLLLDGMNLNQELFKQGWCWWYRKYALGNMVLEAVEKDAREAKKGLWADPQPVPLWEWQQEKEESHQRSWAARLDTSLRAV